MWFNQLLTHLYFRIQLLLSIFHRLATSLSMFLSLFLSRFLSVSLFSISIVVIIGLFLCLGVRWTCCLCRLIARRRRRRKDWRLLLSTCEIYNRSELKVHMSRNRRRRRKAEELSSLQWCTWKRSIGKHRREGERERRSTESNKVLPLYLIYIYSEEKKKKS